MRAKPACRKVQAKVNKRPLHIRAVIVRHRDVARPFLLADIALREDYANDWGF